MTDRRRAFRALIVEDDDHILRLVKTVLVREGFIVEGVGTGQAAIELLRVAAYDLLILELLEKPFTNDGDVRPNPRASVESFGAPQSPAARRRVERR